MHVRKEYFDDSHLVQGFITATIGLNVRGDFIKKPIQNPILAGYLVKSNTMKYYQIKKRWCVLVQDCILYFATQDCEKLVHHHPLRNIEVVKNLNTLPKKYHHDIENNLLFAIYDKKALLYYLLSRSYNRVM